MHAEIEISTAGNPELSKLLNLMPGVRQNTASHALPNAGTSSVVMFAFQVH